MDGRVLPLRVAVITVPPSPGDRMAGMAPEYVDTSQYVRIAVFPQISFVR